MAGAAMLRAQRAVALVASFLLLCAVALLTLSSRQPEEVRHKELELLGYFPPNVINGQPVSPTVKFHIHQTLPAEPHPMTMEAIDKARDAISLAKDSEASSDADADKVEEVVEKNDNAKKEEAAKLSDSRVELWKIIGELRNKVDAYKKKLVDLKGQMMSRDNYLSARMSSIANSFTRTKVAELRRLNDIKVKSKIVESMQGPPGAPGPNGRNARDGPPGPTGPRGDRGPPGTQGQEGPRGYDGRDGIPGSMGPKGDMGLPGPKGPQGRPGRTGRRGPMGAMGVPGKGIRGARGERGTVGPPGYPGVTGPAGGQGPSVAGSRGPSGPPGPSGAAGSAGPPGASGPTGAPGVPGGIVHYYTK